MALFLLASHQFLFIGNYRLQPLPFTMVNAGEAGIEGENKGFIYLFFEIY